MADTRLKLGNKESRDLLEANRVNIVRKAIHLATSKNPDTRILAKLLDKILPTLNSSNFTGDLSLHELPNASNDELKKMLAAYAKIDISELEKLAKNKTVKAKDK